ncbi:MAG TPA: BsuBI/PstI family type II restriction endonuclease [Anaerolineae bacterium]|nr:BsuBI/PstI family type II restriction endonuclease [Anaerolineae bacterium]
MSQAVASLKWHDLWGLYCADLKRDELDGCAWLQSVPAHWPPENSSPVDVCDWLARLYSDRASEEHRKQLGQFFTPPGVARFMASLAGTLESDSLILEPGAGIGILVAAVAERIAREGICQEWHTITYETDPALRPALALALGYIRHWSSSWNVQFTFEVVPDDFIMANAWLLRPAPLFESVNRQSRPQLVISNPPYFKIPKTDPRVAVMAEVVHGQPNIYALFMAAAAKILQPDGQLIFITPRSFCSGPYFRQFRKWFFQAVALERVHVFESRTEAFARDQVLQENLILTARKTLDLPHFVELSSSWGTSDLGKSGSRRVPLSEVLDLNSPEAVLSIPVGPADSAVQEVFSRWPDRLRTLGLEISTGPIVPFRTTALVTSGDDTSTTPVVWVQHVERMAVTWPLLRFTKPQRIRIERATQSLLLPNANYVLVRRFSAKEENSRITAAPYLKGALSSEFLGVENHVNYIHRPTGSLSEVEAVGLAAFLNSRWVDSYFRLSSGNTQVSATELRNLPLPPIEAIRRIGNRLRQSADISPVALINQVVGEELGLPLDLPDSNGGHMPKIEEAKALLKALGLPPAQRNELAALTLLALANLTETDPWRKAQRRSIRIHDMILFIEQNYRRRYAENTRETFRRQVLHQFEQAGIVDRNPDDPELPVNSPRTHYALSEAILPVVQNYGTKAGNWHLEKFTTERSTLIEMYQRRRAQKLIPVKDASGREYRLSPGKHNKLQAAVIEQFAPRFAPHSKLLYLGDAANKTLVMDTAELKRQDIPVDKHSKLPDIILYVPKKNWLYLIEVVTSHGPVSHKRHQELERMLSKSQVGPVYVSVFPDFKEFNRHSSNIAWETEVWIAEFPDHLIHWNSDKFMGPYWPRKLR